MKKTLFGLLVGICVGVTATIALPVTAAVQQYILTQASYPIVVKGFKYEDPELPILNYEGSTYIPLAKIGDLTGVQYRWNDELKQVEIGGTTPTTSITPIPTPSSPPPVVKEGGKQTGCNIAGQQGATLCPDTVIVEDIEPGYKGYPNSSDPSYQWAIVSNADDLPPLLSEGWISPGMLSTIENISVSFNIELHEIYFYQLTVSGTKRLLDIKATKELTDSKNGDFLVDNIRVKKYESRTFFNINDLQKLRVITDAP